MLKLGSVGSMETLEFEDLDDKDAVFAKLDSLIPVIHEFEEDLRSKL